jgi:hypothetical protein
LAVPVGEQGIRARNQQKPAAEAEAARYTLAKNVKK